MMEILGNAPIKIVALGRPFALGTFYDARSEKLIPGITLWNKEKLDKDMTVTPKPNTEFHIVASESISEKTSSMGVEASLKASFLCGLVEVEGAAKYLKNKKASTKQARVTLQYKATTSFKALTMDQLGTGNLTHSDIIDKDLATHVVTGILYGAQAFFVFDRETSEGESVKDIQVGVKTMIEKIPSVSVGGGGDVKINDAEREKVDKFSCTFHGDFILEKSPTTFEEAVKVYQDLPKLLGPNGENAVPVSVYLLPLSVLDARASKLSHQISRMLVSEAENALEVFAEQEMWCNDIKKSPAQNFSQISKNIDNFKGLCSMFKQGLEGTLALRLQAIRSGAEKEAALEEVLKKAAESPFSRNRLNQWMKEKDKEVNMIKALIKSSLKNIEIVPSENVLTDKVSDSEVTLVFVFTSLGSTEPFLSELEQYLRKTKSDKTDGQGPQRWYSAKDVIESVKRKAKLFGDFAENNKDDKTFQFLAVGLADENHDGSTIYMYEDGFRVNEDFELPSKPAAVTVGEVTHSTVSLTISPPSEGAKSVTGYRVDFCEKGMEDWSQQEFEAKAGEVTVNDLSPNKEYNLRVRAITAVGVGPAAEMKTSIKTSPCGPPEELSETSTSGSKISIRWRKPSQIGQDIHIDQYIVEYAQTQEQTQKKIQWKSERTAEKSFQISGLQPDTEYAIRVLCDCGKHGKSHESSTITSTTIISQSTTPTSKIFNKIAPKETEENQQPKESFGKMFRRTITKDHKKGKDKKKGDLDEEGNESEGDATKEPVP